MSDSSPDFLTRAVGYVVGFIATGGLLGILQYKLAARRAPTENSLAQAQTEQIRAQIKREDEAVEFDHMRALAQEARADVQRLREERDKAEAQVKILEHELEQERATRKLGERPGNGKGN